MLTDPWVRDLITAEIERLTASLAQYEKPKRFALIEQEFTYASGELTYTMKMKRRVIEAALSRCDRADVRGRGRAAAAAPGMKTADRNFTIICERDLLQSSRR